MELNPVFDMSVAREKYSIKQCNIHENVGDKLTKITIDLPSNIHIFS